MKRVMVTMGHELELEGGGVVRFHAGSLYRPAEDVREALFEAGVAYPEGEPPTASDGTVFRGAGAFTRRDDHEAALERGRPLSDVPFASATARNLAERGRMAEADFEDVEPSGQTGYTADDVRALRED